MLKKEANKITGGLSAPGKMPEGSYNLPARGFVTTVDQWVQALPGFVSFLAFDNLIIKFFGMLEP